MEKERKERTGCFYLGIAAIIVATIFAIGFVITYVFITKSIVFCLIGGYILILITEIIFCKIVN